VGQRVVLSFKLPSHPPEVVTGVIRYVLPAQMGMGERYGLEFINLDFNIKRKIRNYVATQVYRSEADTSAVDRKD
jgi:hypothetical protein